MYNLPEMRQANADFWRALRTLVTKAGLAEVPDELLFDRPPVPERIGAEVLFSQTCGWPLETIFRGQAIRLGTPCYDADGCEGPPIAGFSWCRPFRAREPCATSRAASSFSIADTRTRS